MKVVDLLFIIFIVVLVFLMSKEDLLYISYFFGGLFLVSVPIITIKLVTDMFKR